MSELWRRLRVLFRRERFNSDLEEEMQAHLEMQAEENEANGIDAEEAHYAARRQFGNMTVLQEKSRETWGWAWLDGLARDTRFALRTLRKNPGFTTVAVLMLALCLGANMAMFALIYSVVLRPVRYRDAGRLMDVHLILTEPRRGTIPMSWSYPKFEELVRYNRSFDSLAAFQARDFTLSGIDRPERLTGEIVSAQYFRTTGVTAVLGRVFFDEEDAPSAAAPVILISHGLWTRVFGADPKVIGESVRVEGIAATVAGVLPAGFKGESGRADVWAPMAVYFAGNSRPGRRAHNLQAIGHLKPGVSLAQADADVRSVVAEMERQNPTDTSGTTQWSGGARPLVDARVDPVIRKALWILQAATLCVLLIGCVNLAGLLLGRGTARRKELAVRLALGTSRGALVRQLLVEPVLLAVTGGVAGVVIATWILRTLALILPEAERSFWFDYTRLIDPEALRIEAPMLIFGIVAALATGIVSGLLPAWQVAPADVSKALKSGLTTGRPHHLRLRNVLVTVQMALALVLLAGGGLLLRSFAARLATDFGVETHRIVTMRVQPSRSVGREASRTFYQELRREAASISGVEVAAVADGLPVHGPDWGTTIRAEGRDTPVDTGVFQVSPEYFRLFRISLVAGRFFDERDRDGAPPVVVLSETAARQFFPGGSAVGRRVTYPSKGHLQAEVIGVAGDVKYGPPEAKSRPVTYSSTLQSAAGPFLAVRAATDPEVIVAAVRERIRILDAEAPVYDVRTMEQHVAAATWRSRMATVLLGLSAALALLLAALGAYGMFSYAVGSRAHEIGIRMAIGARRRAILAMVMRDGLLLCAAALAAGLPAAVALTRVLRSQLYRVQVADPVTFASVVAMLVVVAMLACYIPARRATKIDPMEALRYE